MKGSAARTGAEVSAKSSRKQNGASATDRDKPARLGATLDFLRGLWDLNHALEVTSSRMQRSLGITAQQRMLIRIVGRLGRVSAGRLAALLHVHPGTLSSSLRRLEERGVLLRRRDADDARVIVIRLTPSGRALDAAATGTVEAAVARVLRSAPRGHAEVLLEMNRRIATELRLHRPRGRTSAAQRGRQD